jgi:hypothetical protein
MEAIEFGAPVSARTRDRVGAHEAPPIKAEADLQIDRAAVLGAEGHVGPERSTLARWLINDMLFIAMLLLAIAGVILRLPVIYWVVLTPIFALISVVEGWSHFPTQRERMGLACRVAAIWTALLIAIYLLYNSGVQGVFNANATSLAMLILLALGTFVAGVQARVWQICAVGGLLFLAAPGVGWLDQSPLLLAGATIVVIALGGFVWWIGQWQLLANGRGSEGTPSHSSEKTSEAVTSTLATRG